VNELYSKIEGKKSEISLEQAEISDVNKRREQLARELSSVDARVVKDDVFMLESNLNSAVESVQMKTEDF
jgi:hypothetical protein